MKTKWTLLLLVGMSVIAPALASAQATDLSPMLLHGVTGNLHIHQSTPFGCPGLDGDVPIIGEWFEIAPAEGRDLGGGNRGFLLKRGTVRINPFSVHYSCLGHDENDDYTAMSIELAQTVPFEAVPSGPDRFSFSIPAGDVLLYETATLNGGSDNGYRNPRDPVTGTIDFAAGTVQMQVVVATRFHVDVLGDFDGALTADMSGTIGLPDADHDGVADASDNCPLVPNADQSPVVSPLIRAPESATLDSCLATGIGQPTAADVCFDGPLSVTNDTPSPYPLGSTLVTWAAEDGHGHLETDTQTVTVVDTTPPMFTSVPPDVSMNNCGPANLGLPTATDDCGGSPTFTNDAPPKFFVGPTTVTWTATDISGNHATATQTVSVVDTVPPHVACVPISDPHDRHDRHDTDDGFFRVFSRDACTAAPIIRIGSYVLHNGETIKIEETRKPGVRLVGVLGRWRVKHLHVGRGQAIVTATDGSGNVSSDVCPIRHGHDDHGHDDHGHHGH